MKKIILLFSVLVFGILNSKAKDITDVIMSLPNELILPLSEDQKAILADLDSDTLIVQNVLENEVERLNISPDYVELKTSKVGTTQIKLLPLINNSYIIGVIQTVCDGAVCDSQIRFYTTDWKPLEQVNMFPKKDKDWFIKASVDRNSQSFQNASVALDMTPVKLQFSPKDETIEAIYNIKGYLSEDDYKLIKPYLNENPKVFHWDKSTYK